MGPGGPQLKKGPRVVRGPCGPRGHAFKGPRTWWVQGSRKVKGPRRVGLKSPKLKSKAQGSTGQNGVQSSRVHRPEGSKAQGSTTGQIRSVQSSRARGPNGPIDPKLNQGNLGPRASWLQNARAQEESAGPLGPTGPHHHANLVHCRFFSSHHRFVRVRVSRLGGRWRLGWLT